MIPNWLQLRARVNPQRIALIVDEHHWTYQTLEQQVSRACYWLQAQGILEGQRVGVLLPNSADYVVLVHAVMRLNAILLPLNSKLTLGELTWQLEHAEVDWLLYGAEFAQLAARFTLPRLSFCLTDLPNRADTFPAPEVTLNATQAIVFTSGTTGHPKGAQISYGNHFYSALGSAERIGHVPDDRWLSVLPLYHVGGLAVIFRATLYGIGVVLHRQFDVQQITQSILAHDVTLISLVPTMLYRMIQTGVTFPKLRLILLGGAAASTSLLAEAYRLGLPVAPTYGLTEAASQVATLLPTDAAEKLGSVGKPLVFSRVQIVDNEGRALPPFAHGEVIVHGLTVMQGYLKNEAANAQTLRDGWLYTGDIGYLDADGDLWLLQRRSDLIVSGGENVYPAEVEAVLMQHTAIHEVCVVGLPDAEWGQRVVAVVILQTGVHISDIALIEYCRVNLARYKVPKQVFFWDDFPRTASGKIVRRQIVEQLLEQDV